MKNFERLLLNKLVKDFGFYIKEVSEGNLKWIAKLKSDNGEIVVGVVSKEDKYIALDSEEGFFIKVIMGEYEGEEIKPGEIYFSEKENKVVAAWIGDTPFINIINSIYRNKNEAGSISYITAGLIGINILVFLYTAYLSGSIMDINVAVLYYSGAKVTELIKAGEYWRLLTSAFLHGGLIHIAVNMYSLFYTGNYAEKIYGKRNFLGIYFLSAAGASLMSMITDSISVGASGAIFGLLGALLIFAYKEKDKIGKGFLKNLLSIVAINLVMGLMLPNIDNFGHIGGLLTGVAAGYLFYRR
ncbi:MAG: rhomboid family intramembrane serine protease [Clostridiaceae bacterium]